MTNQRKVTLVDPHMIHGLEEGGALYVVSGRVPGDDEDVTFTLCAKDEENAQKGFHELLADMRNCSPERLIEDCKMLGEEAPYITCTTMIGQVLPKAAPLPDPQHPIQPLVMDPEVLRFKENAIVRKLLDVATANGYSLNEIVRDSSTTREDLVQLYQLIGYSMSGYAELQAVTDTDYAAAQAMYDDDEANADKARIQVLEGTLTLLREQMSPAVAVLYGIDERDIQHGRV